uniref:BSD domain-containing protein n=1 Tax=Syphacia muris TaxID=451379 RepID=A0A0N5ABP8_9BILA
MTDRQRQREKELLSFEFWNAFFGIIATKNPKNLLILSQISASDSECIVAAADAVLGIGIKLKTVVRDRF